MTNYAKNNGQAVFLEDIVLTCFISLLSGIQLTYFANLVGLSRKRNKIPYPRMTGNEDFERVVRAQQNTLEFFPVFMISLWMSTLFFNQVISAIFGAVYICSRHIYFHGYERCVSERLYGFKLGVRCLMVMALLAGIGMLTTLLRKCTDIDLALLTHITMKHYLGIKLPL